MKSKGEKAIAAVLKKDKIKFEYEYPLLIKEKKKGDTEKLRIWYPDFWLPRYSIIIEYWGMKTKEYEAGKKAKLAAYKKLDIECISVKPEHLKYLKNYLLSSIEGILKSKLRHFQNKPL